MCCWVVPGVDAVPGGVDVRDAGAHGTVHADGASLAELDASGAGELDIGADANHHEDQIRGLFEATVAKDPEPSAFLEDTIDLCPGGDGDPMRGELGGDVGAELGVYGRQDRGQLFDDGDLDAAMGERLSAISTPM